MSFLLVAEEALGLFFKDVGIPQYFNWDEGYWGVKKKEIADSAEGE